MVVVSSIRGEIEEEGRCGDNCIVTEEPDDSLE